MTRIEQIIDDIENYIDNCKFQTFSNTNIIVGKDEFTELLSELRMRVPEEIKKYQKITAQQDAILADARAQAQSMLADAQRQAEDIVSEHEIVRLAQDRAAEIEEEAHNQAQDIVAAAMEESNRIYTGAIEYTDRQLDMIMKVVGKANDDTTKCQNSLTDILSGIYNECDNNRNELNRSRINQDSN